MNKKEFFEKEMSDEWMHDLTDRTKDHIKSFQNSQYPETWADFDGIGPIAANTFAAIGIGNPIQLLGKFLLLNKDVAEFYAFLTSNGIPTPRVLLLKLWAWCSVHGIYSPGEKE